MRNTNFNGLDANEIFKKAVERTDAFCRIDYSSLDFKEKCDHAFSCIHEYTPGNKRLTADELTDLKSGIIARVVSGEAIGFYNLARFSDLFGLSFDDKIAYYKRASDMGYIPATAKYARICRDIEERYNVARELAEKLDTVELDPHTRFIAMMGCSTAIRRVEGEDKYPHHHDLSYGMCVKLAAEGNLWGMEYLNVILGRRSRRADTAEARLAAKIENDFWSTVRFMIYEHYYNLGVLRHGGTLSFMLLNGKGCDVDFERGSAILISHMLRNVESIGKGLEDAVKRIVRRPENADREMELKLIDAVFDRDREAIDRTLDEIKALDNATEIIEKASRMLSVAKYSAEHGEVYDEA